MKEERMWRRAGVLLWAAALTAVLSPQFGAVASLPEALVMNTGGRTSMQVSLPMSARVEGSAVMAQRTHRSEVNLTAGEETGTAEVEFRLMGLVPVKTVTVTVERPRILIPGGQSLGVALETEGVVVVGASDLGNATSPAQKAGIRPGDVIVTVDGKEIDGSAALSGCLEAGEAAQLGVIRDGEEVSVEVTPAVDPRDGACKLGVWVRESTAGVGTLTFYDPVTGGYGALGHAITDVDTGVLFPVGEGAVYENEVLHVTRGTEGVPGELTGGFFEEEIVLGGIDENTKVGVFGTGEAALVEDGLYPEGLPVGRRDEVKTGSAQILSTVEGDTVKAYDCEIEKIYSRSAEVRSMMVHITDEELIGKTGGIVQGMSGSPIIQDGKLVGAVTHVLVNDPTRGYGIFIENMLDAAG